MSWMVAPIIFGGYAPDVEAGMGNQFSLDCQNVRFNEYGGIEKVKGYSGFGDNTCSFERVNSIWSTYLSGTYETLCWVSSIRTAQPTAGARLYKYIPLTDASLTFLSGFTEVTTARNAYFSVLNNKVLISTSDGTTAPRLWTGASSTTLSAISTIPTGRYQDVHYDRVFMASSVANPSRLWWSALTDPTSWDTGALGDWVDFDANNGDAIIGIKSYMGEMYVFKRKNCYKFSGNDFDASTGNFSVQKLIGIPGTDSHNSIVVADGQMYWHSDSGFVKYNGSNIQPIGYGLVDKAAKTLIDATDTVISEFVYGAFNPITKDILWKVGESTTILAYNTISGKWSKIVTAQTINAIDSNTIYSSSKYQRLMFYGGFLSTGNTPSVYTGDNTDLQWNGTPISAYHITDWLDMGTWQRKANPRWIMDLKRVGDWSLSANIYYDDDPIANKSFNFGIGSGGKTFQDVYSDMANFRNIKLKLANNTSTNTFTINKMALEYELDSESGRI